MPHSVDIDSIHQNIFILLNICYAARVFSQNHDLGSADEPEAVSRRYYCGLLKFTLSEKLIDTAIKTRIIFDMLRARAEEERYRADGEKYSVDTRAMDEEICQHYNIGFAAATDEKISLRGSCNKIIHAFVIRPIFERGEEDHILDEESEQKREWEYWGGALDLSGRKGKEEWHFTLHISELCVALEDLMTELEHNPDWQSLHYDGGAF